MATLHNLHNVILDLSVFSESEVVSEKSAMKAMPMSLSPFFQLLRFELQPSPSPDSKFDADSVLKNFTWYSISDKKSIPGIYRGNDRVIYCNTRMAEQAIKDSNFGDLPQHLTLQGTVIKGYRPTSVEIDLLQDINWWHCDSFYGTKKFTTSDHLVRLDDLIEFYSVLTFAKEALLTENGKDFTKSGFVRCGTATLIPYVVNGNEKCAPLFYFTGINNTLLTEKAENVDGWRLAFLKVCCQAIGVGKQFYAVPFVKVVKLSAIETLYPPLKFLPDNENCWSRAKACKTMATKTSSSVGAVIRLQRSEDLFN